MPSPSQRIINRAYTLRPMLSLLWGWLDPRRSVAARLAWVVVLVSLLLSLLIGLVVGTTAKNDAVRAVGSLHAEYAQQLADQLDDNLNGRLQNVQIMAGLVGTRTNPDRQRALLNQLRTASSEYAWIGLADLNGKVIAATDHVLEGEDVTGLPWFAQGKNKPWVGEVHDALPIAKWLPVTPSDEPFRFVDVTAPAKNAQGQTIGVLGAYLSWGWIQSVEQRILAPLSSSRSVEALIVSAKGQVLLGPETLLGQALDPKLFNPDPSTVTGADPGAGQGSGSNQSAYFVTANWPNKLTYLTSLAHGHGQGDFKGLGWTIVVREPASTALAPADQLQWRVLLFGLSAGLLATALGVWLTRRIAQPLNQIANAAERIQRNQAAQIPLFKGQDEVAHVSRVLNSLVNSLEARNRDLQTLNATLEQRVNERTHEIERLSAESERAAVGRERLRMARDLHDTLAHTLAGLLTQIRLTRKIALRDPKAVAGELAMVEQAAQQGLQEARLAVTNLRANPVRDLGLASALEQRLSNFAEQYRIYTSFNASDHLSAMDDERAETMYRVFEESLRNIQKHAHALNVHVLLKRQQETGQVVMSVCDDGVGFDPAGPTEGHFGLHGMREQCDLIHARLDVTSAPGQGTRVDVTML